MLTSIAPVDFGLDVRKALHNVLDVIKKSFYLTFSFIPREEAIRAEGILGAFIIISYEVPLFICGSIYHRVKKEEEVPLHWFE